MEALFASFFSLILFVVMMAFALVMTAVSFAVPAFIFYRMHKANAENQRLLQTGSPASAQVRDIVQTGVYINHNPQCRMTLEVQPADASPSFVSSLTTVLPMVALARFQPGTVLDVRYDPLDTSKVAIAGM